MTLKTQFATLALAAFGFLKAEAQTTADYSWTNLPKIQQPTFKADTVRITTFGAKPDGHTLNTKAINEAIEACSKKGGGVVLIPSGLWITGPVVMKSNVNLHLKEGCYIAFYDG
jgi:polygalacturonase